MHAKQLQHGSQRNNTIAQTCVLKWDTNTREIWQIQWKVTIMFLVGMVLQLVVLHVQPI